MTKRALDVGDLRGPIIRLQRGKGLADGLGSCAVNKARQTWPP